ncbi:MAG TPA: HAD family hydrolase [Candidatus Saccharimonas sp.]|nr:HAD family hydrolase [Candidatus Saccharimonas sp.]
MDEVYSPQQNTQSPWHFSKIPNYVASSIRDIDYDRLLAAGVRHFVFDWDNTLVTFGASKLPPNTLEFLKALQARPGVATVRIATNSIRDLRALRRASGLEVVQPAPWRFKPLPDFYRHILKAIHDEPASICMIGDKLLQDVWGANHAGFTTVLVQPLGRDNWFDRLLNLRRHEHAFLRKYLPQHVETWF